MKRGGKGKMSKEENKPGMDILYQYIINYIKDGPGHERRGVEVRLQFNIGDNAFRRHLTNLTNKYPIYQDETGRIVGILV